MRAVFTFVTVIFIVCVSVTITSFAEVPLWKLETQPPKPHDFLNDNEENVNRLVHDQAAASEPLNGDGSDAMAKTTSYGTLSNAKEAPLELPRSVRCFICQFSSNHLGYSYLHVERETSIYDATTSNESRLRCPHRSQCRRNIVRRKC